MARKNILRPKVSLSSYRKTIDKYLPFVLIRCVKYTNNKQLAEIISIYAFISAYLLCKTLDGANKIEILIDNMVGVVGEDLRKKPDSHENGQLLFEDENVLFAAMNLAEMNTKELLAKIHLRMDYLECFFDRVQFDRINVAVIDFLENKHCPTGKWSKICP